jgi:hypothetical protein
MNNTFSKKGSRSLNVPFSIKTAEQLIWEPAWLGRSPFFKSVLFCNRTSFGVHVGINQKEMSFFMASWGN